MFGTRSRIFFFAVSIFLLSLQSVYAQTGVGSVAEKGKLVDVTISAPSLKGNLLGDPVDQNISVYLPPGYETSAGKRYPVVYLLHGFGGNNHGWMAPTPRGFDVPSILDALIAGGRIREMIVVAPNARNALGGSFYLNSAVTGNWEDYIYRDVVTYVDANYRTLARPASRGIAGHSMGGFGAVYIAMMRPDIFTAIYALSPCCLGLEGDFNQPSPAWKQVKQLTSVAGLPKQPKSLDDFYQHIFVALPAAFSPNANVKPFYGDPLYQEQEGKLVRNEVVSARWRSKMPLYLVESNKQNLMGLRGIFLDYGQKEEFPHIRIATTLFSKELADSGIPHTFEVYEGGDHVNKVKLRLETHVFRFFSDKLDFSDR